MTERTPKCHVGKTETEERKQTYPTNQPRGGGFKDRGKGKIFISASLFFSFFREMLECVRECAQWDRKRYYCLCLSLPLGGDATVF